MWLDTPQFNWHSGSDCCMLGRDSSEAWALHENLAVSCKLAPCPKPPQPSFEAAASWKAAWWEGCSPPPVHLPIHLPTPSGKSLAEMTRTHGRQAHVFVAEPARPGDGSGSSFLRKSAQCSTWYSQALCGAHTAALAVADWMGSLLDSNVKGQLEQPRKLQLAHA